MKGKRMTGRLMVFIAGFALLSAPQAIAQDESDDHAEMRHRAPRAEMRHRAPGPNQMFDRAIGRMMDRRYELDLSDDQLGALDDLRGDARSAMAPIREEMEAIHAEIGDGSLTREDAGERMKGIHERVAAMATDHHDRLGEILEPEQQQMLRHGMARHGSRRGMARHGRAQRHGRSERHGRMERHGQTEDNSGHPETDGS